MSKLDVKSIKVMSVCAKCADLFTSSFLDGEGKQVGGDYSGYVPDFFPGKHYGDYVELDIELDTGKILNWRKPSEKAIKALLKESEE
jgi:hypothetical protein